MTLNGLKHILAIFFFFLKTSLRSSVGLFHHVLKGSLQKKKKKCEKFHTMGGGVKSGVFHTQKKKKSWSGGGVKFFKPFFFLNTSLRVEKILFAVNRPTLEFGDGKYCYDSSFYSKMIKIVSRTWILC